MHFRNPIHRHSLIAATVCLALFVAVAVLNNPYALVVSIICIAVAGLSAVLLSGKCQHCGLAIPHTRFAAQVLDFPTHCVRCGGAFAEPRRLSD